MRVKLVGIAVIASLVATGAAAVSDRSGDPTQNDADAKPDLLYLRTITTVPTAQPTACSPREFEVKIDVQPGADQVSIGAEFANLRPHACEMKAQLFLSVKDVRERTGT